jgi:hypothetical protein
MTTDAIDALDRWLIDKDGRGPDQTAAGRRL